MSTTNLTTATMAAWGRSFLRSVRLWLRNHGIAPLGFAQKDYRHHHQLLRVWGPFQPARWEVWRWPVGMGSSDKDEWLKPLRFGSSEMYHRIGFSAELVYSGHSWPAAKAAVRGIY